MSTVTCPNGHQSADPEWCDTCGTPIGGAATPAVTPSGPVATAPAATASPAVTASPAATPAAETCPHCGTLNPSSALFCESCGYDFTTGQAPPEAVVVAAPPAPAVSPDSGWVVIVEIDPEWFALKGELADQPCPPVSTSTVALSAHTSLVGRSSQSKNIHPEIALDGDTGVSRRHAQFVRAADGDDLAVVDLSSTNGTYVVEAGQQPSAHTEPIATGSPMALHDGDRVYVGAWSRLTVRRTR